MLKIEDSTEWSTDSKVRTTLHVFTILVIAVEPTGRYSVVLKRHANEVNKNMQCLTRKPVSMTKPLVTVISA